MPSIFGYLVKEAISSADSHPPLDSKRCLNNKQRKMVCSACVDVCPGGVLIDPKTGKADWTKCLSCGLCSSVCPSGAMGFADYRLSKARQMLSDGRSVHVLGCSQANGEMDSRVWCLGSYPWELIAALALVGRVELLCGDCAQCAREKQMGCLDSALERTKQFLGDVRFMQSIVLRAQGESASKAVTRRELFGKIMPGSRKKAGLTEHDAGTMRQMLLGIVKKLPDQEECFGWRAPAFTDQCWACGICAKVCPNDALKVVKKDDVWRMVCLPVRCTSCGVCEAVCMNGGIDGIKPLKLPAGKQKIIYRTTAKSCSKCGAAVRMESEYELCMRCRAIQKSKK